MRLRFVALALVMGIGSAQAFDSPEHKAIGDTAWHKALADGKMDAARLLRLLTLGNGTAPSEKEPVCAAVNGASMACFSFGDLVAIYGDWAKDYAEVNGPGIARRANVLKGIVQRSIEAPRDEKANMMALAQTNFTHFSGEALAAYVKNHDLALHAAADKNRLREALHYEALALHSFTDLFAVGHMLEDREMTKALVSWAQQHRSIVSEVPGRRDGAAGDLKRKRSRRRAGADACGADRSSCAGRAMGVTRRSSIAIASHNHPRWC